MQPLLMVVAPHVNPAFFGRGGMGPGGVGMWPDPTMGGWGGEEQASYGDDAASDQQYDEGGTMGKRGHPRGSGPVHQRGGGKGRRICPQHRIGQRRGVVMSQTWPETGIVTLTEIGSEIVIGRGKKSGTGKGIGIGMTETAIAIIT
jgi:hypothetical protein